MIIDGDEAYPLIKLAFNTKVENEMINLFPDR